MRYGFFISSPGSRESNCVTWAPLGKFFEHFDNKLIGYQNPTNMKYMVYWYFCIIFGS